MKSRFVKSLALFLFALMSAIGVAGQEECVFKNDAARLFGLKLKMSPAEAKTVFGKDLKIKNKNKGEYIFFQNYIERRAPNSLSGVRALYLRFFGGKLYQIEIFYEHQDNRQTLADFIGFQTAKLDLPVSAWQIENNIARADCGEVSLVADVVLNPRIELTDEAARAAVEEIRQKSKKK